MASPLDFLLGKAKAKAEAQPGDTADDLRFRVDPLNIRPARSVICYVGTLGGGDFASGQNSTQVEFDREIMAILPKCGDPNARPQKPDMQLVRAGATHFKRVRGY